MTATNDVIRFLRARDYEFVRELGQGACGKTVLLHDDLIGEDFVCKKYVPYSEEQRESLFKNFIREIKLLHQILHPNVVRVFNYYIYPEHHTGYILMEFVSGTGIDDYVKNAPEKIHELFLQVIDGFRYLESRDILHRDIRPQNIMVRDDGVVKIIDLGFGKRVQNSQDFGKSISLNWWCELPNEFNNKVYDFTSEVYFVGRLFERLVQEYEIDDFKYVEILGEMCRLDPQQRVSSFFDVQKTVQSDRFFEMDFADFELNRYRRFADFLQYHITKIETGAKYAGDPDRVLAKLDDAYRGVMLETTVPDAAIVTRCFVEGTYYYNKTGFPVSEVRDFLHLLKSSPETKRRIILSNIHTRLDAISRYENDPFAEDVPF